jgi:hypothetical protein
MISDNFKMVLCFITSHIDHVLRKLLLLECIKSLQDQVQHIYVSLSYAVDVSVDHEFETTVKHMGPGRLTLLLHDMQQSQFQHIAHMLKLVKSDDTVLLMDDDDVASPNLIDSYQTDCRTWIPSRYQDKTTLQRDLLPFNDLVIRYHGARISKLNEISGTIIKVSNLQQFMVKCESDHNLPLLDGLFNICHDNPIVCPTPLIWQRNWRASHELAAWELSRSESSNGHIVAVCEQLHDDLFELLKVLHTVLTTYNIIYWIDSGTLLGAIRHNGNFIPWNDDADVTIFQTDISRFEHIIWLSGYRCIKYKNHMWKLVSDDGSGYPFVDIFTIDTEPSEDGLFHYCCDEFRHETLTSENMSGRSMIQFRDQFFPSPNNPVSVLSDRYGKNWKTHAVCVEMHGDRYYGRLPMIAEFIDEQWVRLH